MRIQGKIRGDMSSFSLKHNPDNGARFAYVSIDIGCDRDRTKKLFGEDFEILAFATAKKASSEDDGSVVTFGYKSTTPNYICEHHQVELCGHGPINTQPKITSIRPVKDEEKVVVTMQLPILIKDDKTLAGDLAVQFGELIEVSLDPSQQSLFDQQGMTIKKGAF